jgi:hypothetical protein
MKKYIFIIALVSASALAQSAPTTLLPGTVGNTGGLALEGGLAITTTGSSHTLSPLEWWNRSIIVSGTATSIVAPLNIGQWYWVTNSESGSITWGGATGSRVTIPSGATALVNCDDGADYVSPTGGGGGSGISGGTAGQAAIFGSPTTITSGIPINGTGAGLVTGPTSAGSSNLAVFSSSAGAIADSSLLLGSVVTVNGTQTITNKTYNGVTLGNTTPVVPHMSLRFWVFGDSYDQTFGATVGGNSYVQLVADDTPAREMQFAVGGTTEPTIAESTLANFTPDTTFPSTVMTNGGNNDYTADTCGHVSPSNCIANYINQLTAAIGWTAFPPQDRTLASNGTVGTGCTANSTVPLNSINGNVAGTAESCTTAGSGITWSIPAANSGLVAIVTTNTNGAAGTYSVSIDGTLQTDNCTTTTTFGIGGCNGTAQNESISPQSQVFSVTPGVAHTIIAVPLTANPVIFIAAEWEPATLPTNQNATFVNNSGAAFDISGIYSVASAAVVNRFNAAGLPVFPVNIRAALLAVPNGGIGTATATCPGTTFTNHPNDCGHYAEYQAMLAEEQSAGYVFSSQGLGAKYTAGDGNIYAPWTMFQGQVTSPGSITFKNTFANFNGTDLSTGPTAGDTASGWVDFLNGAGNDVSGWRMGSGAVLGVTGNFFKHTVFGAPGVVDYFCGEAMNAPSSPGVDASYSTAWCLNSSTGLSYTAGNISSTKTNHAATAFTVTASTCGTTTILNAGPSAGTFTTTATTCNAVINLPTAPTGWACFLRDLTTPANLLAPTATTVSTATFSGTVVSGDTLQLTCPQGY